MANLEERKIEDGMIIGIVKTAISGSDCDFEICSVEHWEKLTEAEAAKLAIESMYESGMIEVWW